MWKRLFLMSFKETQMLYVFEIQQWYKKWYQRKKDNVKKDAKRSMKQAAKIMLGLIRSIKFNTGIYSLHGEINNIELGKDPIISTYFMQ